MAKRARASSRRNNYGTSWHRGSQKIADHLPFFLHARALWKIISSLLFLDFFSKLLLMKSMRMPTSLRELTFNARACVCEFFSLWYLVFGFSFCEKRSR